jgi:hypothetical protein
MVFALPLPIRLSEASVCAVPCAVAARFIGFAFGLSSPMKSSIGVISEGVPPPITPKEYPAHGEDDVQIVLSSFR